MKRKNKFLYAVWLAVVALAMAACSVDQHFEFPQGPQGVQGPKGEPGLSAYQMWVEWINNGNDPDYTGGTSEGEFYLYFKGAKGDTGEAGQNPDPIDPNTYLPWPNPETGTWWVGDVDTEQPYRGENGENGDNGAQGISAYAYWVTQVELGGVTDPNTGELWPDDMTSEQNFWEFLAAADGASAYKLWKDDVLAGLIKVPYDESSYWPTEEVGQPDFWRYLRGRDGIDGRDGNDGKPGAPGTPGREIKIQLGKPNVIAQYYNEPNSEFIDVTNGEVAYLVYNEEGLIAPYAIVKGMPGMSADKEFVADENGRFTVKPGELPVGKALDDRFGECEVTYLNAEDETVTETSAYNVYVPERMFVRIRLTQAPVLVGNNFRVYAVVERRVTEAETWQSIPSYLGELAQNITSYEVSDPGNPDSYDPATSKKWDSDKQDISAMTYLDIARPTLAADHIVDAYQDGLEYGGTWDNQDHYFTVVLNQYYGETPSTNAIVKVPPMQYIPLLGTVSMSGYISGLNAVNNTSGTFDVSKVNYNLLFERMFKSSNSPAPAPDGDYFTIWEPQPMEQEKAKAIPVLRVTFVIDGEGGSQVYHSAYATLGNPTFNIPNRSVYVGSWLRVDASPTSTDATPAVTMFRGPATAFADFRKNGENYTIETRTASGIYMQPDIIIDYTE